MNLSFSFNFENKVKQPSNTASDSKGNAVFDKSRNIVDKKKEILLANQNPQMGCTNTRSSRGL